MILFNCKRYTYIIFGAINNHCNPNFNQFLTIIIPFDLTSRMNILNYLHQSFCKYYVHQDVCIQNRFHTLEVIVMTHYVQLGFFLFYFKFLLKREDSFIMMAIIFFYSLYVFFI